MAGQRLSLLSAIGLHARPAAVIAEAAVASWSAGSRCPSRVGSR